MDIVGVAGVAAEAELLAAICALLQRLRLGPADVVVKVSSRGVLAAVLGRAGVPAGALGAVAVVVDKLDKLPRAKARAGLLRRVLCRACAARVRGASGRGRAAAGAPPHAAPLACGAGAPVCRARGAAFTCKGGSALAQGSVQPPCAC